MGTTTGRIATPRRAVAGLLLLLMLLLAACGGGETGGTEASGDAEGTDTADADADTDADAEAAADADADDQAGGEEVELTLALFGDFGYDPLIEEYEAANPGVTITTQIAEMQEHHDGLTTSFAAGSGAPDIAAVEVGFISAFKDQPQHFQNLKDFGADEVEGDYLDWKWDQATTVDGSSVIGLPTDVGGMAMCYRQDLFAEAGLPSDRDEVSAAMATWDDYLEMGRQYVEATDKAWANNGAIVYQAVVGQSNESYYDAGGELVYDTNENVARAWDVAATAIEDGLTANIALWGAEWNAGMSNGDYATLTCPAWMMGYIQGQAPDSAGSWDIADLPDGGGNWGGSFLVLPAQSENAQASYDFISWLLAPEQQLKVFTETGNFPSTPELYESEEIQGFENEFFNNAPVGPIYARNAQEVVAPVLGPAYETIDTAFEDGLGRIEDGTEPRDEAWESTIGNIGREVGN
jgi:cellobiose transport system substrate-binding protein